MPFHMLRTKQKNIRKRRLSSEAKFPWLLISQTKAKNGIGNGRAALYTLQRASLTVEAAFVLPLFLLAMTMLVGVIDVCRIQVEQSAKLAERAKKLSMYAYGIGEHFQGDMVDLYDVYTCKLPVTLYPHSGIKIALRARVHTWTGKRAGEEDAGGESQVSEEMVYMTEDGSVYHTDSACTYLDLAIHPASHAELGHLRNEYGSRYHSCEKCGSDSTSGGQVFVSEKGEKYHSSLQCSGLKRTVKLVRKSEISGMHQCSRCQKGQTG